MALVCDLAEYCLVTTSVNASTLSVFVQFCPILFEDPLLLFEDPLLLLEDPLSLHPTREIVKTVETSATVKRLLFVVRIKVMSRRY